MRFRHDARYFTVISYDIDSPIAYDILFPGDDERHFPLANDHYD